MGRSVTRIWHPSAGFAECRWWPRYVGRTSSELGFEIQEILSCLSVTRSRNSSCAKTQQTKVSRGLVQKISTRLSRWTFGTCTQTGCLVFVHVGRAVSFCTTALKLRRSNAINVSPYASNVWKVVFARVGGWRQQTQPALHGPSRKESHDTINAFHRTSIRR